MAFADYFVAGLLREAGWPRRKGLLRRQVVDTQVLDLTVHQLNMLGVGLGVGRPELALRLIVATFDRDWTSVDEVEDLLDFLDEGADIVAASDGWAWEALTPGPFNAYGDDWRWSWLGKPESLVVMGGSFSQCLAWGLLHHEDAEQQLERNIAETQASAEQAIAHGLHLADPGVWKSLDDFYGECERLIRQYESERQSLPDIPEGLWGAPRIAERSIKRGD